MNLLIRKNFNTESGGGKDRSYGKGGTRHRKPHNSNQGGRSRDSIFCPVDDHCNLVRTHLFLNTNSPLDYQDESNGNSANNTPPPPTKSSSAPLIDWTTVGGVDNIKRRSSINRTDYLLNTNNNDIGSSRKVSFDDENGKKIGLYNLTSIKETPSIVAECVKKAEPVTLANLDKDCFIIPIANIDRFLPPGVPMPTCNNKSSNLSVLEIEDPKLSVVVHLMSQMEPIEPILEAPLMSPLLKQKQIATALMQEIGSLKIASEGILLSDLEKNSAFPYIAFYFVNRNQSDPYEFFQFVRRTSIHKFNPQILRYTTGNTFDLCTEVATIARPPLQPTSKKPRSNATGYIVTIYKVFEGDDNEKFEKNWLYWTGARMIYRHLPKSAGLRRITLHKSQLTGDKLYLLIVECNNFLRDFSATALLIPALRARLCGYTGIYRSIAVF